MRLMTSPTGWVSKKPTGISAMWLNRSLRMRSVTLRLTYTIVTDRK